MPPLTQQRLASLMPLLAAVWRRLPLRVQWRLLWLLSPKFTLGVSGVVFDQAERVLLLRHTFRRRYPWGMVSGWVRGNEALEAALHREMAEETGLSISIERPVAVRKDRYDLFIEAVFACRWTGGVFRPSNEVSEVRWCDPGALPPGTHPDHAQVIRQSREALKNSAGAPKIALE